MRTLIDIVSYGVKVLLILGLTVPAWSGSVEQRVSYLANSEGYWQVWVMNENGEARKQVTRTPYDKNRISWFPDGHRMLVNGLQGELAEVDVSTGAERALHLSLSGMTDAALSPDGKTIAFSLSTAESLDNNNLWLIDLDGKHQRKLTHMEGLQHDPSWSPDGEWLYFLSGKGKQSHDIWRVSTKSGSTEQLTAGQLYHFDVAVSAQGTLAFSSNRSGNYEIWVQRGQETPKAMTDDPAMDGHPAWLADGRTLIFESSRGGALNLWKLDVETRRVTQLTHERVGARSPVVFIGAVQ